MFLLGIDYGTGGAKAAIIDTQGAVLSYSFEEYPILTPRPGWSEHDPDLYWEIACRIIPKAITEAKIDPKQISCLLYTSPSPRD